MNFDVAKANNWCICACFQVGAACAVYNNKLYVVGGYNSRRGSLPVMDNVECLDLASNSWIIKQRLPEPRCHASLVVAMSRCTSHLSHLLRQQIRTPVPQYMSCGDSVYHRWFSSERCGTVGINCDASLSSADCS